MRVYTILIIVALLSLCARDVGNHPHCVRPIQNWGSGSALEGVSDHQERPKAFPMAHMNHMVIVYKHTECNGNYVREHFLVFARRAAIICATGYTALLLT